MQLLPFQDGSTASRKVELLAAHSLRSLYVNFHPVVTVVPVDPQNAHTLGANRPTKCTYTRYMYVYSCTRDMGNFLVDLGGGGGGAPH